MSFHMSPEMPISTRVSVKKRLRNLGKITKRSSVPVLLSINPLGQNQSLTEITEMRNQSSRKGNRGCCSFGGLFKRTRFSKTLLNTSSRSQTGTYKRII